MQEILDIFLEKSKHHHSNIIYAQIYKNDVLKEEFRSAEQGDLRSQAFRYGGI